MIWFQSTFYLIKYAHIYLRLEGNGQILTDIEQK